MTTADAALTAQTANAVYDVLVDLAAASPSGREDFVFHQTREHVGEYRFFGSLGSGGRLYRDFERRPDGTFGDVLRVSAYREDLTPARRATIAATNAALAALTHPADATPETEEPTR